ncbi:MAG: tetratricopeptide repeat protein, partial [Alphaproteobacteria bacterium]
MRRFASFAIVLLGLALGLGHGAVATRAASPPDGTQLDRRSVEAHAAARAALGRGDARTAQIHLRNAVRHDPRNLEARRELGRVNLQLGDAAAADKDLQQALQGGLDPALVLPDYAAALLAQRRFDKLLAERRPGARATTVEAAVLSFRGVARLALGQLAEAEAEYRASLALAPSAAAQLGLARIAARRKEPAEAARLVDAALVLEPANAEALL